jgi:hypothetical protein
MRGKGMPEHDADAGAAAGPARAPVARHPQLHRAAAERRAVAVIDEYRRPRRLPPCAARSRSQLRSALIAIEPTGHDALLAALAQHPHLVRSARSRSRSSRPVSSVTAAGRGVDTAVPSSPGRALRARCAALCDSSCRHLVDVERMRQALAGFGGADARRRDWRSARPRVSGNRRRCARPTAGAGCCGPAARARGCARRSCAHAGGRCVRPVG